MNDLFLRALDYMSRLLLRVVWIGTKFHSEQDGDLETESILTLAAIIRDVDSGNKKGAADLAESILSHPKAKQLFREHQ